MTKRTTGTIVLFEVSESKAGRYSPPKWISLNTSISGNLNSSLETSRSQWD